MAETLHCAILLPDIVGSVPLYERIGDTRALDEIGACIDRLRAAVVASGGRCIQSKGDDVLSVFDSPDGAEAALEAARRILIGERAGMLGVHAGLHFGPVIEARGGLFGDAVNLTARLSTLAKPGEVLASEQFVEALPEHRRTLLRAIERVTPKGKSAPVAIFSMMDDHGPAAKTTLIDFNGRFGAAEEPREAADVIRLRLVFGPDDRLLGENERLLFGRSTDCDLVMQGPWVSRHHAQLVVRGGRLELADQSSSGTYVKPDEGHEFFIHRESVVLAGSGAISPTLRTDDARAECIRFEIVEPAEAALVEGGA